MDAECSSLGNGFACFAGQCRERGTEQMERDAGQPTVVGTITVQDASSVGGDATLDGVGAPVDAGAALDADTGIDAGDPVADTGASPDAALVDEPICDGSDTLRLSVQIQAGGYIPSWAFSFATRYGDQLLLLDGHCRFYARGADSLLGMRTGTVSASDASELAQAIGWSKLATWSTLPSGSNTCEDGASDVIRRPGAKVASCFCQCDPSVSPERDAALAQARPWVNRLFATGQPLTGPVTALARQEPMKASDEVAWPLTQRIASITGLVLMSGAVAYDQGARFELASEAAALRALRAQYQARAGSPYNGIPVSDRGLSYTVAVRDELPDAVKRAFDVLFGVTPK